MKKSFSSITTGLMLLALTAILAGCAGAPSKRGGGYYKDDGPMANAPKDLHLIPDATPRIEPFAQANLRPYQILGMRFEPIKDSRPFSQTGTASWYGKKFHGNATANGERYDMYSMTAAHPTLPLPSYARVTRLDNNKSIIVRINDRGPFHGKRIIDLSYAAASKLDMIGPGHAKVRVEAITHDDIRTGRYQQDEPVQKHKAFARADQDLPSKKQKERGPSADPLSDFIANQERLGQQTALQHNDTQTAQRDTRQDGFFLQFGAFRSRQSADQLAQRLNSDLAQDYSQPVHINNHQNYYRVRLGPFNSRTEAANAAMHVQRSTGQATQITYED